MKLQALYPSTCRLFIIGHWFHMALALAQDTSTNGPFQADCAIDQYYGTFLAKDTNVLNWDPVALATLLRDSRQQVLPYTSSSQEDVWDALIDLDSNQQGIINLIYSSNTTQMPASVYGTPDTWNREHLWPQSRGVESSGPDFTDVHHLRPADATINAARGNLFFGDCQDQCTSRPATPEAAPDTGRNSDMFLPPAQVRGDIARALFYMALRYSFQDEEDTQKLELTDCPQDYVTGSNNYQMGYLSDLLQWHQEDPPDDSERLRNEHVCSRWQGNRNVFIDYPELVAAIYGEPAEKPYSCDGSTKTPAPTGSNSNGDSTMGPTRTTAPSNTVGTLTPSNHHDSLCGRLNPGAIQVISFTSDNPDAIVLVAMEDLPEGLELYMTDNAWTGSGFKDNEGTLKLQLTELVPQGSVFGYGNDDDQSSSIRYGDAWESVGSGVFALATAGDSVLLFCIDHDNNNEQSSDVVYHHLGGFISGTWTVAGTSNTNNGNNFDSSESYIPDALADLGAIEISGGWDNLVYTGPTSGTKANLGKELMDSNNWQGSNSDRLIYTGGNFDIQDSETKSSDTNNRDVGLYSTEGEAVLDNSSAEKCPVTRGIMMVGMGAFLAWSTI